MSIVEVRGPARTVPDRNVAPTEGSQTRTVLGRQVSVAPPSGDIAHREQATATAQRDVGLEVGSPSPAPVRHRVVLDVGRGDGAPETRPSSLPSSVPAPVVRTPPTFVDRLTALQTSIDTLNARLTTARTRPESEQISIRTEIRLAADRALKDEVGPLLAEKRQALQAAETATPQVQTTIDALRADVAALTAKRRALIEIAIAVDYGGIGRLAREPLAGSGGGVTDQFAQLQNALKWALNPRDRDENHPTNQCRRCQAGAAAGRE
jgi:hypothetical protein